MENKFLYRRNEINEMIDSLDSHKVCMQGVRDDLIALKSSIEDLYSEDIFYLGYWEGECPHYGWSWTRDREQLTKQKNVTSSIDQKFLEIYALILAGLGERCKDGAVAEMD